MLHRLTDLSEALQSAAEQGDWERVDALDDEVPALVELAVQWAKEAPDQAALVMDALNALRHAHAQAESLCMASRDALATELRALSQAQRGAQKYRQF